MKVVRHSVGKTSQHIKQGTSELFESIREETTDTVNEVTPRMKVSFWHIDPAWLTVLGSLFALLERCFSISIMDGREV